MIVRAFVTSLNLITVKPTSNPLIHINNTLHFVAMTPLQLENSLTSPNFNSIKTLIVGGGFVKESIKKEVINVSTQIFETYGMTETLTHIAIRALTGKIVLPYFIGLDRVSFDRDSREAHITPTF